MKLDLAFTAENKISHLTSGEICKLTSIKKYAFQGYCIDVLRICHIS